MFVIILHQFIQSLPMHVDLVHIILVVYCHIVYALSIGGSDKTSGRL